MSDVAVDPQRIRDLLAERDVRLRYVPRTWAAMLMACMLRFMVLVMHRRAGKAQPLSARVLTPTGFKRMGDLVIGDLVLTPEGKTAKVIGVYPQGPQATFRVRMADGSSTRATADHLWKVHFGNRRRKGAVMRTEEIATFLSREQGRRRKNRSRPLLETWSYSADYGTVDVLPLDPYVLGLLIGDGGTSTPHVVRFSTKDQELLIALGKAGFRVTSATGNKRGIDYYVGGAPGVVRAVGLAGKRSWEKSIPEAYLKAPRATRLALLQGLMDTDGYAGGRSNLEYCTTSPTLAQQVTWLARSLGFRATLSDPSIPTFTYLGQKKNGRPKYRVAMRYSGGEPPFRLARKRAMAKPYRWPRDRHAIVAIEPSGVEGCQCIEIDDPGHQYVTDDFIVTHNTVGVLNYLIRAARDDAWEIKRLLSLEPSFTDHDLKELLRGRKYVHVLPTKIQAEEVAWGIVKYYTRGMPGVRHYESDLLVQFPKTVMNPEGSTLRLGGADDPDAWRGGAYSGAALDEFSQIDPTLHSEVLSKALADHLGFTVFLGTLKGKNILYRAYKAALNDPAWFAVWRDVAESIRLETGATVIALKRAMVDDQMLIAKGLMTQEEYDQEWFLSTVAAIKGAYYSKQIAKMERERRITKVPHDPALPVHTVWDLGSGPQLFVGCWQRFGPQMRLLKSMQGHESDGIEQMITRLRQEAQDRAWILGKHFAPHDVRAREVSSGKTRKETAAALGWKFEVVAVPKTIKNVVDDGIALARAMLDRTWIDQDENELFLDAVGSYQQGYDKKKGVLTGQPVHNWASHPADMLRYASQAEPEMTNDPNEIVEVPVPPIVFEEVTHWTS